MRKLWLIVRREYRMRVRTRTFILSTVGLPALMLAAFVVPLYVSKRHVPQTQRIAVVDEAGGLARLTASRLDSSTFPTSDHPQFHVVSVSEQPADPDAVTRRLRAQIRAGSLDGYLLLPPKVLDTGAAEYHTRNSGGLTLANSLESVLTKVAIAGRLAKDNVAVPNLDGLLAHVRVDVVETEQQGEARKGQGTFTVAMFLAGILYGTLIMYGVTTMRAIQEEKSTRMMEILLSSVRPFPLLAGKILGVAAAGFTQYLIWAVVGAAVAGYGAATMAMLSAGKSGFHLHLAPTVWIWFVVYFLGGYFLYSSLFAAVGAAVSSEQEMNQAQVPISLLLVAGFFMFPIVTQNPGSTASVILTMVPFFSPVLMMLRIAIETPPLWQILISVGILAVTAVGVVYLSSKIYRVGVLMYGKRPSAVELLRWLRYS